jgi:hypothetical protein
VDALERFVSGYNGAVHWSTGMAPSFVGNKDVLRIWERTRKRHARPKRSKCLVYCVRETVRIIKEKRRLTKKFKQDLRCI